MDQLELWQAYAMLGQHRHPDWWDAGAEEPESKGGRKGSGGRKVRSPRDNAKQLVEESRATFAARRAAARGEGPKPQAAPHGNSPVMNRLRGG